MPDRALATAFLAGEPAVDQLIYRATQTLGRTYRWLPRLARQFAETFPLGRTRPRHRDVVQFLRRDPVFRRALRKLSVDHWLAGPPQMQPVPAAAGWPVPPIETAGALADWLAIDSGDLEWFADLHGLNRKGRSQLRHYHYRLLTKQSGAHRLIEAPKPRLKDLQRKILAGILEKIPPHGAVHGFRKRHSIKTFVTPHVGRRVVLKMDLEDFFPSISGARVQALFRTIGYPGNRSRPARRYLHYGRSLRCLESTRPVLSGASPAGRADLASARESLRVSCRLPFIRPRKSGGS
jgi:RNA-directed DNA polymerase